MLAHQHHRPFLIDSPAARRSFNNIYISAGGLLLSFKSTIPAVPGIGGVEDQLPLPVENRKFQIVDSTCCTLEPKAIVVTVSVWRESIGQQVRTLRRNIDGNGGRIETALIARCHYIVSGDNDLLTLQGHEQISICTPAQFLAALPASTTG